MSGHTCPATTKAGKACKGYGMTPAGYCNAHEQQDVEYWAQIMAARVEDAAGIPALSADSRAAWRRIAAVLDAEAAELAKLGDDYATGLLKTTAVRLREEAPEPASTSRARPLAASKPASPPMLTLVTS